MAVQSVDAKTLSRMFLAGAKNIEAKKEFINELNVFPVPDGDTGTNMFCRNRVSGKGVSLYRKGNSEWAPGIYYMPVRKRE